MYGHIPPPARAHCPHEKGHCPFSLKKLHHSAKKGVKTGNWVWKGLNWFKGIFRKKCRYVCIDFIGLNRYTHVWAYLFKDSRILQGVLFKKKYRILLPWYCKAQKRIREVNSGNFFYYTLLCLSRNSYVISKLVFGFECIFFAIHKL